MDIEKAIIHAKEVASEKYAEGMLCHANPDDGKLDECIECAKEHEQLAELQQYRERIEQLRHTEVILFRCKLPDGRICHFSDLIDYLEKGEVK